MIVFLPPSPPPQYSDRYMVDLSEVIRDALRSVISKDSATNRLLLQSPNSTVYEITVSDAGVLTATVNDGKSRL